MITLKVLTFKLWVQGLLDTHTAGPQPSASDSAGCGGDPVICIYNKFRRCWTSHYTLRAQKIWKLMVFLCFWVTQKSKQNFLNKGEDAVEEEGKIPVVI